MTMRHKQFDHARHVARAGTSRRLGRLAVALALLAGTATGVVAAAPAAQAATPACGTAALVAINTADTNLYRWTTTDAAAHQFSAATRVGTRWSTIRLVASDATSGNLFAVDSAGNLRRYRWSGSAYTDGTVVSVGWGSIRELVPAGNGVLFARDADGRLRWYRWLSAVLGQPEGWSAGSGTVIGSGWDTFSQIFSGGNGIVYGVKKVTGELLWYRNRTPLAPTPRWEGPSSVGTRWGGFREITDVGGGYIFAINAANQLVHYHHLGAQTGTFSWEAGSGGVVGGGWKPFDRLTAAPVACDLLDPPIELRAYPGGDGIGLRWNPPAGSHPSQYTIYRDGTLIGRVNATSGGYTDTARFVDRGLAAGVAHVYRIATRTTSGATTAQSYPVAATLPANTTPVPNVILRNPFRNLDRQAAFIVQTIRDWYPKFSDQLAWPTYRPPHTFTVVIGQNPNDDPGDTGGATTTYDIDSHNSPGGNVASALTNPRYIGVIMHEATHMLQQYPAAPPYIGEGMAVWATHNLVNDANTPYPPPGTGFAADGPYLIRSAASLFADPGLPRAINLAAHNGAYAPAIFLTRTGHTIDNIWFLATHPNAIP
jgi:Tachylectin